MIKSRDQDSRDNEFIQYLVLYLLREEIDRQVEVFNFLSQRKPEIEFNLVTISVSAGATAASQNLQMQNNGI